MRRKRLEAIVLGSKDAKSHGGFAKSFEPPSLKDMFVVFKELDEYRMHNNDLLRFDTGWDKLMLRVKPLPEEKVLQ